MARFKLAHIDPNPKLKPGFHGLGALSWKEKKAVWFSSKAGWSEVTGHFEVGVLFGCRVDRACWSGVDG